MSNYIRHQTKRKLRAEQKKKENRIHRNASRKNSQQVTKAIPLSVIKQEMKNRRSIWRKVKDKFQELQKNKLKR